MPRRAFSGEALKLTILPPISLQNIPVWNKKQEKPYE
jgi:hypothetical protein